MLRVGCGKAVITPENPAGHPLAGYIRRMEPSQGVHDDIFVEVFH
ncbi:MAG: hypothetical protein ACP5PL_04065 [Infirmifilum sp.]